MKKLIIALSSLSSIAFAGSLDMSNLYCNKVQLTSITTLADVQKNCKLIEQKTKKGVYQVEFTNDAGKKVTCNFATNQSTALLNSCK